MPNKYKFDFRTLIRRGLKERKMSVPELARAIKKNHQTIYNYLSGRTSMRDDTLAAILAVFDINQWESGTHYKEGQIVIGPDGHKERIGKHFTSSTKRD